MRQYNLVLCPLHGDQRDFGGTLYPDKGYVKSQEFQNDDDITTGLYGYLWANSVHGISFAYKFAVVRLTDKYVVVDDVSKVIKFEQGYVLLIGNREDCIARIHSDPEHDSSPESGK